MVRSIYGVTRHKGVPTTEGKQGVKKLLVPSGLYVLLNDVTLLGYEDRKLKFCKQEKNNKKKQAIATDKNVHVLYSPI